MKSIDMSAARGCGRADTTNASMLNAKRILFIIVSNVYEAFDFSAPEFIQLLIRKVHPRRACFIRGMKRLTTNEHEWTLGKREKMERLGGGPVCRTADSPWRAFVTRSHAGAMALVIVSSGTIAKCSVPLQRRRSHSRLFVVTRRNSLRTISI